MPTAALEHRRDDMAADDVDQTVGEDQMIAAADRDRRIVCSLERGLKVCAQLLDIEPGRAIEEAHERVIRDALSVTSGLSTRQFTDVLGNRCDRLVAPCGELNIRSEIVAEVTPHVAVAPDAARTHFSQLPYRRFTSPCRAGTARRTSCAR